MSLSIHRKSIYSSLSAPNTTDLKAEATDSKCILFVASVETILTHSYVDVSAAMSSKVRDNSVVLNCLVPNGMNSAPWEIM